MDGLPTEVASSSVDMSIPGPTDSRSIPLRFFGFDSGGVDCRTGAGAGSGACVPVPVSVAGLSGLAADARVCGCWVDMSASKRARPVQQVGEKQSMKSQQVSLTSAPITECGRELSRVS